MQALTERQRQLLERVREHLDRHGRPPTRMELAEQMGFRSPNAAEQHLRALARKGYIALDPGGNRNIRLLQEPQWEAGLLPVIGRVAAGAPILAAAHVERRLRIDPALFEPPADYLLRVKGLSLRDAGILEDDWLAVHRSSEARRGQLVVVRLGEEVTAKRLEFCRGRIRLLAENPDYPPIEIDPAQETCAIEGIVVGVIRTGRL